MNFPIYEISQHQADLIKTFALFYLLLISNHVDSSMITCFQLNYVEQHKWLKIVLAFFLLYFLVTILSETGNIEYIPPIQKLIYTFFYFIAFIFAMRLDLRISLITLFLIFMLYFLEINKDFYLDKRSKITNNEDLKIYNENQYWLTLDNPIKIRAFKVKESDFVLVNKIETVIYYIIIFLLVVGFISYSGEIHDTLRRSKDLTWLDVISDTSICKVKDRKSFWHYFKVGMGMKI